MNKLLIIAKDFPSEKTPLLKKYGLMRSDLSLKLPNFNASFSIASSIKAFL